MNCPNCSAPNADGTKFCIACGSSISSQQMPSQQPTPSGPIRKMRPLGVQSSSQPGRPNQQTPTPPQRVTPPQSPSFSQSNPPVQRLPLQAQQYSQPSYQQQARPTSSANITSSFLNIWGPFAGYGTRRRHVGWLMDGQANRYQNLLQQVNQRLTERQIPNTTVDWELLTSRGVVVENRPYFIIRRGLVSLGLNIGPFGNDLFISMATYLKPPISNFRVLMVCVMVIVTFFGFLILGWAGGNAMSTSSSAFGFSQPSFNDFAISVLCLFGPIHSLTVLSLIILLFYSLFKFFKEKDFFAALRVPPNEFNEDDLMALEKAVEQTIRSGLDDIGLNPADLKPAAVQGNETRLI